MAIRIVHNGNPATKIIPSFDECIIESVVNDPNGEDAEKVSFVMDVRDGKPTYKRIRTDEDTVEYIHNLNEHDEIASVIIDEEKRDIIITLRELGEEPLDIGEIPDDCPE